jgi:hypothetical protein
MPVIAKEVTRKKPAGLSKLEVVETEIYSRELGRDYLREGRLSSKESGL